MAYYTKKDFALLCGIKTNYLSNYIKRGKIVLTGKFIDDKLPANAAFLQKYSERSKKIKVLPENKTEKPVNIPEDGTQFVKEPDKDKSKLTQYALEHELKLADLAKKEADTLYRELQIQKLQGQSIPTDLVKDLISQLSKSLVCSFKDGADSFLIEISKRKGLSVFEQAELKGKLIEIINLSSSKAIADCKKNMKIIVEQYSDKREVGQHD